MEKKASYKRIKRCRICGNPHLEQVLDLGTQMLTGVFPQKKQEKIISGPLRLVKCVGDNEVCGLLQLEHSFDAGQMYGKNYGYRSGLNPSMVNHLQNKIKNICAQVELRKGDLIIDIGSNDSTALQAYSSSDLILVGIDPTGVKFRSYYPHYIQLIPDFFSLTVLKKHFPEQKAKVITSFSMFYDLEDPLEFMRQVYEALSEDGIWVFEQSYMPSMLENNAYDTVCHEHLEFYALRQIKWMTDKVGFRIVDVEFNDVNGGSFSVTVAKANDNFSISDSTYRILKLEEERGLNSLAPYRAFAKRVEKTKNDLLGFLKDVHSQGKTVAGLGASTKGNVLLQYCGLTDRDISFIGEVNVDKYGCYTPGTWIPIISEEELLAKNPDYLIVLPWHFRKFFQTQKKYRQFNLVFPLPELEIVSVVKSYK
ncbi:MAG: class I SAM-dependent methyltransferase [Candidatus Omnitrophica bacterium]|nr:class I SAM-dependent methyltransferase [Candidatus Omnitrophota bacterium]